MMLKNLFLKYRKYKTPIEYARTQGVSVGDNCKFITYPNFGSEPWLISIGNHVELSGYVSFFTHDGATWLFTNEEKYKDVIKYGKVIIHDNCFIGAHVLILPGVEIGKNSIVGAGSVVTKSLPPNGVYAGNPAEFICSVDDYKERCYENTPAYDVTEYKQNKKQVVLKLLEDKMRW